MTLIGTILASVASRESFGKYHSPPPEPENIEKIEKIIEKKKRKKRVDKYANVRTRVDTSPPSLHPLDLSVNRHFAGWKRNLRDIYEKNIKMVIHIRTQEFQGGAVDSHWKKRPEGIVRYHEQRQHDYKKIQNKNKEIYNRIINTHSRVVPTKLLLKDWSANKEKIFMQARMPFVLFPAVQTQCIEDAMFIAPEGVKRPRIYLLLGIAGAASLGELTVELFTDVCPATCKLFTELADGDGLGHGYVGTCFFTKVPGLYWSGGDVIYNNGFGCYAQRGRTVPIGAENYHFPHSMPGLLSMRMTKDDEMCGSFNITFKRLTQFDLKNVVFGRVIRPSKTYDAIREIGAPLTTRPVVEIRATRRKTEGRTIYGKANQRIIRYNNLLRRKFDICS